MGGRHKARLGTAADKLTICTCSSLSVSLCVGVWVCWWVGARLGRRALDNHGHPPTSCWVESAITPHSASNDNKYPPADATELVLA